MKDISETEVCPRDDIAAYVDGELSAEEAAGLERHVDECPVCSRSLMEQRQFLAALSASLEDGKEIVLPSDFAKKIVSNAESSVAGLRRPNELFTAIFICAALFLFVLFAFGGETFAFASAAGSIGEKLLAVGSFLLKLAGNVIFAVAVVSRGLASHFDVTGLLIPVVTAFFVVFIFLSSRWMIRRRNA